MNAPSSPRPRRANLFHGEHSLTVHIILAIILAFASALAFPHFSGHLHIGGEIFLNFLKMLVVPLVITSVMSGILGMGDVRKLGRPGGATILYYLSTTVLAVLIGMAVVNFTQPGVGTVSRERLEEVAGTKTKEEVKSALRSHLAEAAGSRETDITKLLPVLKQEGEGIRRILENLVLMLFTDNLVKSAMNMDILPLIVFSIIFSAVLTTLGNKTAALSTFIQQANDALLATTLFFIKFAPLGIFCLVAARFGDAQASGTFWTELSQIGQFFTTVLASLAIHGLLALPLIFWIFTRQNPFRFIFLMSRALLTAFSTASSSATLPLTMETAIDNAGVSPRSAKFVIPLGATINMDGTALYEAVAAMFVAQVAASAGLIPEFDLTKQIVVVITATLAAIGAAGIPEAGLVTMIIVFNAVGLPVEYIGLILSVDWLLDRFRTTINVLGDAMGARIVQGTFGNGAPD